MAVRCYLPDQVHEHVDPDDISELVGHRDHLLWVDLTEPSDADLRQLQEEFSLHPLAMEDVREPTQRPKLEQYPTHAFVVAYSKDLAEIDLFVGPTWLVSVRNRGRDGEPWPIDGVRRRFERTRPEQATVGFLLYTLLDELVDGYFDATDAAEERLEALEDTVFSTSVPGEQTIQQQLFGVRRDLLLFRRAVVPLREVLAALLRREVAWIDEETLVHLQDVFDHVLRSIDLLDGQRELTGNAVDAHLAIISNRLNEAMKKMTSWGAILLVSSLIAGIYGMNFEHMPELDWRFGYPMALAAMVTVTLVGYWYFSRKDWL